MLPPSKRRSREASRRTADEDGKTTMYDRSGENARLSFSEEEPTALKTADSLGLHMAEDGPTVARAPMLSESDDGEEATSLLPSKQFQAQMMAMQRSYEVDVAHDASRPLRHSGSNPVPAAAPSSPAPDRRAFRQLVGRDAPSNAPAAGNPALEAPTEPLSFAPLSPERIQAQIEAARQARLRSRGDSASASLRPSQPPASLQNTGARDGRNLWSTSSDNSWSVVAPPAPPSAWPSAAPRGEGSGPYDPPPTALSTTGVTVGGTRPVGRSASWVMALSAMALFGALATIAIVQGKGDELVRTGAAFVDPTMLESASQPPAAPEAEPASPEPAAVAAQAAPPAAAAPVAEPASTGLDTSVVTAEPAKTVVSAATPIMMAGRNNDALSDMAQATSTVKPAPKPVVEKVERPVEKVAERAPAKVERPVEKVAERPAPAPRVVKPVVVAKAPPPVREPKPAPAPKKSSADEADLANAAKADALAKAQLEHSL